MSQIRIVDLEVHYHVGVPDEERAHAQRLLLTVEIGHDFSKATANDRIKETIDYNEVVRELLAFGAGRSWKLIETVAAEVANMVLKTFGPQSVTVEVKKFVIPEARYVSVVISA
jgi:7,8-dihydroneopterin aldolase/epimerase/oxygenase